MELMREIRRLSARPASSDRVAVLARWELGAALLYHGGVPVVASGYHRNLAGIRDVFTFWTRASWRRAQAILRRRRVRWVVWQADPTFLSQVDAAFGDLGRFASLIEQRSGPRAGVSLQFEPAAERTLWMQLLDDPDRFAPALRLLYESRHRQPQRQDLPAFRIFEVR